MKNQVITFIKTDRTISGGRNLYNQLSDKSLALQHTMARMSDTPENRNIMCYELCRHVGIPDRQLRILLKQKVQKSKLISLETKTPTVPKAITLQEQLLAFDPEDAEFFASKTLAKELGIVPLPKDKVSLYNLLSDAKQKEVAARLQQLPIVQKQSIKLREQFPFLRQPSCPDSLKLLVTDLITAYENFVAEQPKLHDAMTAGDAAALAKSILANYISNKEAYVELKHYRDNGTILGAHPLFARLELKEEITKMSSLELNNKIVLLTGNINRNKKKEGNAKLVARDEELLQHAKSELAKRK